MGFIKLLVCIAGYLRQERLRDEDDELLQFAIQQSMLEAGSEGEQVSGDLGVKLLTDFTTLTCLDVGK